MPYHFTWYRVILYLQYKIETTSINHVVCTVGTVSSRQSSCDKTNNGRYEKWKKSEEVGSEGTQVVVEAEVIHKVEAEGTGDIVQLKMQTMIVHLCFVALLKFWGGYSLDGENVQTLLGNVQS